MSCSTPLPRLHPPKGWTPASARLRYCFIVPRPALCSTPWGRVHASVGFMRFVRTLTRPPESFSAPPNPCGFDATTRDAAWHCSAVRLRVPRKRAAIGNRKRPYLGTRPGVGVRGVLRQHCSYPNGRFWTHCNLVGEVMRGRVEYFVPDPTKSILFLIRPRVFCS